MQNGRLGIPVVVGSADGGTGTWWLVVLVYGGGRLMVDGWWSFGGVGGLPLVHGGRWWLVALVVGTGTCWPTYMMAQADAKGLRRWHWWYVVVGTSSRFALVVCCGWHWWYVVVVVV